MSDLLPYIRILHVASAAAWFGEVIVINFILIPVLSRYQGDARKQFVITLFPKVFNLASVLSATSAITGAYLVFEMTGGDLSLLTKSRWGTSILIGGSLGLLLTLFHFFMENKLAKRIGIIRGGGPDAVLDDVHLKLKIVPRVGLLVMTTIFFLMLYAVRGLP